MAGGLGARGPEAWKSFGRKRTVSPALRAYAALTTQRRLANLSGYAGRTARFRFPAVHSKPSGSGSAADQARALDMDEGTDFLQEDFRRAIILQYDLDVDQQMIASLAAADLFWNEIALCKQTGHAQHGLGIGRGANREKRRRAFILRRGRSLLSKGNHIDSLLKFQTNFPHTARKIIV